MKQGDMRRRLGKYLDAIGVFDGEYAYKGPATAQIDLTNDCNNNCIGCWCNSPLLGEQAIDATIKSQYIPLKRALRLLDELHALGTRHIYYAGGGEPFMHPQIMRILRHTKQLGMTCYVNTNFTLVDEQKVKELVKLRVDHLTVSVWAGTPQVYAATHPNKNEQDFAKLKAMVSLLNKLKAAHPIIKLYNVVFNLNYHDVEAMVDFAEDTGSETVEFTVIDTMPGKTDSLLLKPDQARSLLEACQRIRGKRAHNGHPGSCQVLGLEQFIRRIANTDAQRAAYDSNIIGATPCYAGWAFVRILADGNVNSCLKSHRYPVGNIHTQSFRAIWNSRRQKYFRRKTRKLDPSDSFFSLIGNDPKAEMGCYKSCDNIGHNMELQGKLASLSEKEKKVLGVVSSVLKFVTGRSYGGKEADHGRNTLAKVC
jgi:MoaA/NifB/PqqE/SkfB family radical SAM enzyme